MIGTAAALALSRKSPSGAVILEQTCLGSSQRALRSSTSIAVLLLSRVSGFGSGRFGPSCAQVPMADSVTQRKNRADRIGMLIFSFQCTRKVISGIGTRRPNRRSFNTTKEAPTTRKARKWQIGVTHEKLS